MFIVYVSDADISIPPAMVSGEPRTDCTHTHTDQTHHKPAHCRIPSPTHERVRRRISYRCVQVDRDYLSTRIVVRFSIDLHTHTHMSFPRQKEKEIGLIWVLETILCVCAQVHKQVRLPKYKQPQRNYRLLGVESTTTKQNKTVTNSDSVKRLVITRRRQQQQSSHRSFFPYCSFICLVLVRESYIHQSTNTPNETYASFYYLWGVGDGVLVVKCSRSLEWTEGRTGKPALKDP